MLKTKILIVESGGVIALDLQKSLQRVGYSVPAVANSGLKAINLVKKISPDLVVIDFELKGELNGVMAAKQISTQFNIPVIYLTACKPDDVCDETWRYICKPIKKEKLYTAVKIALEKKTAFHSRLSNWMLMQLNSPEPLAQ